MAVRPRRQALDVTTHLEGLGCGDAAESRRVKLSALPVGENSRRQQLPVPGVGCTLSSAWAVVTC